MTTDNQSSNQLSSSITNLHLVAKQNLGGFPLKAAFSPMAGAPSSEAAHCKLQGSPNCKWNWKISNYLQGWIRQSFTWEKRMNCDNFATFPFLKTNQKTFFWGSNLKKSCCLCNCEIPQKRQNMFPHALNSVVFAISATFSNSSCISIW